MGETEAQNSSILMNAIYGECGFQNSHTTPSFPMTPTILRSVCLGESVALHKMLPIILEFKGHDGGEYEGLLQVLERIIVFAQSFHII